MDGETPLGADFMRLCAENAQQDLMIAQSEVAYAQHAKEELRQIRDLLEVPLGESTVDAVKRLIAERDAAKRKD